MPFPTGSHRSGVIGGPAPSGSRTTLLADPLERAAAEQAVKEAMRARIREERRRRTGAERREQAERLAALLLELPEVAGSGCVAAYASTGGEPGTGHLRAGLQRYGVRVILPVVLPDGGLDWAVDEGDLRPATGFGGPEPTGPRLGRSGIREAGVVLVPALAVDTLGNRLGQGGGYYDRALPLVDPAVPVLALVHDGEVLDAAIEPVPAGPDDHPVDAAVTPQRCLRLPRRRR